MLAELFDWSSPGVKTHRTWVIAPDSKSLSRRWDALRRESNPKVKEKLFHPDRDRYLDKVVSVALGSHAL
ncbi:type ISP restriction/modification enzyme, partial [Allomesorhizobium camelthorni]|uniref:type ISP restriction/modification enzyme n=1 Tax=Allomesorhizobium camelthorni TaxID=475069 RepID=UPI001FE785D8